MPSQKKQADRQIVYLTAPAPSVVLEEEEQEETGEEEETKPSKARSFKMNAYTGQPVQTFWYGKLALDLEGVEWKDPTGILLQHDVGSRVGVTESIKVEDDGIKAEGRMLRSSPAAQEVLRDSGEGFPFQASVKAVPKKVEELGDGVEAEVNGYKLEGPATIFREWDMPEISFVPLGADSNTTAETFASEGETVPVELLTEETTMPKKNGTVAPETERDDALTPAQLRAMSPEDRASWLGLQQEVEQQPEPERDRATQILEAATDLQRDLAVELVKQGVPVGAALAQLHDDLKRRFSALHQADESLDGGNVDRGDLTQVDDGRVLNFDLMEEELAAVTLENRWVNLPDAGKEAFLRGVGTEHAKSAFFAFEKNRFRTGWNPAHFVDLAAPGEGAAYEHGFRSATGNYWLGIEETVAWVAAISSMYDSDQPQESYPWLGQNPPTEKWTADRSFQQLRGDRVVLINDDFESTIEFKRQDFRRDKTGQISARVRELGQRVGATPARLITALLKANGTSYTGSTFFNNSHSVGKGTFDNNMEAGDLTAVTSAANQLDNILKMIQQLMGFVDDQGEPMNEEPREFACIVPTAMWQYTVAALQNDFVGDAGAMVSNTLTGMIRAGRLTIRPFVNARLNDQPKVMYVNRMDAAIKPMIWQEEVRALETFGPSSERAMTTNKVAFGGHISGQAGYGRPELIVRGTTP